MSGEGDGSEREFELLEATAARPSPDRELACAAGEMAVDVERMRVVISRQEAEIERLRRLAETDPLTGAATPWALQEAWRRLGDRAPVGVVAADIDGFFRVNARAGRRVGDAVLRATVVHMQRVLRWDDVLARTGSDEFTVLLPGAARPETVSVACRLRAAIQQACFAHQGLRIRLSLTMGLTCRAGDEILPALLERADEAMRRAKHWGGGRIALA